MTLAGKVTRCWDPPLFLWTEVTIREFKENKGKGECVGWINHDGFSLWTWMLTLLCYTCVGDGQCSKLFHTHYLSPHLLGFLSTKEEACTCTWAHTHTENVHPHVRIHTHTHPHVHTHMHTHIQTCTHAPHTCADTHIHICAFTHRDTHAYTNAQTRRHAHAGMLADIHTQGAHTCKHAHAHTQPFTHIASPLTFTILGWSDTK